ncbi:MAG: DNA cytosine methyltransferase [Acidiferrobacterales bacterium]|nr:DNA cytosine methyltransferase [Acidiferrobacterales bacterium]
MHHTSDSVGEVVDLFCGIGGLSHGLLRSGFNVLAGYDIDARCKFAFEKNNRAKFFARDVAKLTPHEIKAHYTGVRPSVLAGCAPCQPFSAYKRRYDEDPKWNLVKNFAQLAALVQSDFVTMENVPALVNYKNGSVFSEFCEILSNAGYYIDWSIAKCEEFSIPQKRRRLVLVASKHTAPGSLLPDGAEVKTVRQSIDGIDSIKAGQTHAEDVLHASASLTKLNKSRIQASKPGGTWRDWPEELQAACHRRSSGKTYSSVYGRMAWDAPSPTITTQCYGFGNGRFGHPEQDRAISLREAAILQSFPFEYEFLPPGEKPSFTEVGRWIGNAVPVRLGEEIGKLIANAKTDSIHDDRSS